MPTAENEQRRNILRLRRRFLKDQEKTSITYAQKEIRQQRQKKVFNMQKEPAELSLIYPYLPTKPLTHHFSKLSYHHCCVGGPIGRKSRPKAA